MSSRAREPFRWLEGRSRSALVQGTLIATSVALLILIGILSTGSVGGPEGARTQIVFVAAGALLGLSGLLAWRRHAGGALVAAFLALTCLVGIRPLAAFGSPIVSLDNRTEVFVLFNTFPGGLSSLLWTGLNPGNVTVNTILNVFEVACIITVGCLVAVLIASLRQVERQPEKLPIMLALVIACSYFVITPRLLPINNGTWEWIVGVSYLAGGVSALLLAAAIWLGHRAAAMALLVISLIVGQLVPAVVFGLHEGFPTGTWFPFLRTADYATLCQYMTGSACTYGLILSFANEIGLVASVVLGSIFVFRRAKIVNRGATPNFP